MEAASIPALRKLEPGSSPPLGLFLAGNLWDSHAEESRPQGHALPGSTQESTPFQALSPQAFHSQAQEDFGTSMRMTSPRHLPHRCGLRPQQQVNAVYEHRQSTAGGQDHHVVRGQVRLSRYRNCLGLGFGAQWAPPFGHASVETTELGAKDTIRQMQSLPIPETIFSYKIFTTTFFLNVDCSKSHSSRLPCSLEL